MKCPSCSRPVAVARGTCVYCGTALSDEVREAAASAAQRVLQTTTLAGLESAAMGRDSERQKRYLVIETTAQPAEILAEACGMSVWDARQWQAASRYRLLKVVLEAQVSEPVSALRAKGLHPFVVHGDVVARARSPIPVESLDVTALPLQCTLREDPDGAVLRKALPEPEIALIISAPIKRERQKEQRSRVRQDTRMEEAWLVHVHLRNESRPWEIDPRRTAYEGPGLASAHMRTLELVRRLSHVAPFDEAFKNIVPALSPGSDPSTELAGLQSGGVKPRDKEQKTVVLDNVAQFREYSAWRGALERLVTSEAIASP